MDLGRPIKGVVKCVTECDGWGEGVKNCEKRGRNLWTVSYKNQGVRGMGLLISRPYRTNA
jgi:hypothetical protein